MNITTFITGSKLYGIDTENSDTDIRNIVLESFHNVLFNKNYFNWRPFDEEIEIAALIYQAMFIDCWALEPFFINEKYFLKPIGKFEKLRKLKHLFLNESVVHTILYKTDFYIKLKESFETRYAVNTIRVCWLAEDILKGGEPQFTLTGKKQKLLLDIKAKNKKFEKVDNEIIAFVENLRRQTEKLYENSKITTCTGIDEISKQVQEIYLSKWNQ